MRQFAKNLKIGGNMSRRLKRLPLLLAAFAMSGAALATTFTNLIEGSPAPDPFIVWDDATRFYYHLHTQGDRLELYRARHAAGISRKFLENTELHKQKQGE